MQQLGLKHYRYNVPATQPRALPDAACAGAHARWAARLFAWCTVHSSYSPAYLSSPSPFTRLSEAPSLVCGPPCWCCCWYCLLSCCVTPSHLLLDDNDAGCPSVGRAWCRGASKDRQSTLRASGFTSSCCKASSECVTYRKHWCCWTHTSTDTAVQRCCMAASWLVQCTAKS